MLTERRFASSDQAAFLADLIEHQLIIESGVPGIYGHNDVFEDVRLSLEQLLTREAVSGGAVRLRFPPLLRRQLETSEYLASFPDLAGTIYAFEGSETQAALQNERASCHEDWSDFQHMTELTLMPAACYPVYPAVAVGGRLPGAACSSRLVADGYSAMSPPTTSTAPDVSSA